MRNQKFLFLAIFGATLYWSGLSLLRGPEHPGLKDEVLKNALRKNHQHEILSYKQARTLLFTKVDGNGKKAKGRYTGETFSYLWQPLPNVGNMGHLWPRTRLPKEAVTNLHHVFAFVPEANIARNALKFGNVFVPAWSRGNSKAGVNKRGRIVFEVRPDFRGDVARAMFYISTMYKLDIDAAEEVVLRQWHKQDAVSIKEKQRNDTVANLQKSRNPFIDNPKLVDRIRNF